MQMYDDTMDAIHSHLIQKSTVSNLIYTAELNPTQYASGEMLVFPLQSADRPN
jgi:mannosyl-oligosaccharide alpha-1,2-mannosidase